MLPSLSEIVRSQWEVHGGPERAYPQGSHLCIIYTVKCQEALSLFCQVRCSVSWYHPLAQGMYWFCSHSPTYLKDAGVSVQVSHLGEKPTPASKFPQMK